MRHISKHISDISLLMTAFLAAMVTGCSTTSTLEPGEQLYTGMKKIQYENYESKSQHFFMTQEEMEYALAAEPNGALFGSAYYRTPFPYGLWIWNAFANRNDAFSKWITSSFGKAPVILGDINPELRTSVAQSVLQNHGYFRGTVDYDVIEGKPKTTRKDSIPRPRTGKIAYRVNMGHLFTLDSIAYTNFPDSALSLIKGKNNKAGATMSSKPRIHRGDPFDISELDAERQRISEVFRNNGYYYYQPSFTSYRADTLMVPGKVQLQLHLADSLPNEAIHQYVIGKTSINLRRTFNEQLKDSIQRRRFAIFFNGSKPQVRARVILNNVKLRRGNLYSQSAYQESVNNLTSTGIFSSLDIKFNKRDTKIQTDEFSFTPDTDKDAQRIDTLDMIINATLDKPYDFTLEAKYMGKTSGRMGPGVGMSFAKRNAFRGGEVLSLNLGASYEFQTSSATSTSNDYQFSGDVTLMMPRLVMPFVKRRRWQVTPTTLVRFSAETINRGGFFTNNIFSGEMAYTFYPSSQTRHQFSPLIFEYSHLGNVSEKYYDHFESIYSLMNMQSRFVPKMRYTYNYTSPLHYRNPITFGLTLSEAGSIISLARMAIGKSWNDKGKTLFHTEYSQFVKVEAEWKKTWRTSEFDKVIAHAALGYGYAFGNSESLPFSEMFYIGGANDIRAFASRTIGPGSYYESDRDLAYALQIGNIKFVGNIEYRPRLFGSLYGALFCDFGNVWRTQLYGGELKEKGEFRLKNLATDLALGIGAGIRYDLDFFVIRLDWGIAIHSPYSTGTSGYFNINSFKDAQCINFAIGYPF